MSEVDAFILVGGRSSRLGTDKAFVELGGSTLAERAVDLTRKALSPERVTMVAGNATQFSINAAADVPIIFDLYEGRGPLGALNAALAEARTPWIFVLACDFPFVTADLIRLIAEKRSDEFGSIVPVQKDGRIQPLCAFYRVETATSIVEKFLLHPGVSPPMHELVAEIDPRLVEPEEYEHLAGIVDPFTNINTLEDLDSARQIESAGTLAKSEPFFK